ncbi:CaiB/BaiF CoA transferase family protein [Sphingomonas solaris]|uniref:CoA transferase n=1 Tax=Alterirhizorhabdus solaris TaxID=2529389 RepID=A0A558RB53_9SPHN|nr:CoA transferase [Sphingomonas solaris]TVV76657.1 CoA transferase [Sphingomonas solaris]
MSDKGIFSGVRVLELAQYVFVPGAGVLLADQGAEVIKIESTGTGDPYRTLIVGDGREVGATNLAMEQNNRGKKSIALDLKSAEGREAFLKLVETADVFLTSLRPKALRSLKLDIEDLKARNPRLIYARGNGYGFKGAEADKAGFDASAFWARGGMSYAFTLPGNKPTPPRAAFGDHSGSVALAFGIAGALFKRAMTGEAPVVETSLLSTAVWMLSSDLTYSQVPGYKVHHDGPSRMPLMELYPTRDGRLIQLMLLDPRPHWPSLCRLLGLDELIDDPLFADNKARMQNAASLSAQIGGKIAARDWADWQPEFDAWDAPWELVRTIEDVTNDPQVHANGMMFDLPIGESSVRVVSGPSAFDGQASPVRLERSPGMGAHTDALLTEVGYSADALADLKARRLVQ